jgi:hypothetical protein
MGPIMDVEQSTESHVYSIAANAQIEYECGRIALGLLSGLIEIDEGRVDERIRKMLLRSCAEVTPFGLQISSVDVLQQNNKRLDAAFFYKKG